jgi:hypothetical protein
MRLAIFTAVALLLPVLSGAGPGHAGQDGPAPAAAAPPKIMPARMVETVCPGEGGWRSTEGRTPTYINFANRTGQAIRTYWLDYQGRRRFYNEIPPGTTHRQPTYLTHPWVVTDANGNCLRILMPERQEKTHSIF